MGRCHVTASESPLSYIISKFLGRCVEAGVAKKLRLFIKNFKSSSLAEGPASTVIDRCQVTTSESPLLYVFVQVLGPVRWDVSGSTMNLRQEVQGLELSKRASLDGL
jgi:hypothetical protein